MSRIIWSGMLWSTLLPSMALAQGMPCDANTAWLHVRQAYPNHIQTLAQCENKLTGERVIVMTEPPPHLVRGNANRLSKRCSASRSVRYSINVMRSATTAGRKTW